MSIHLRRRDFIVAIGGAAAWPLTAKAQQSQSTFQIGFLYPGTEAAVGVRVAAFRSGLHAGGVRADQISMIIRVADGDPRLLKSMAADLVRRKVDLIQATGPMAVRAAREATLTVPIVAGDLESDPIGSGFIESHRRPGGNITGTFLDFPDFSKKWLEALKEAVPQATTVAIFWDPMTGPAQLKAVEAAARTLGLKLVVLEVEKRADFETGVSICYRPTCGRAGDIVVAADRGQHQAACRPRSQAPPSSRDVVLRVRAGWRVDGLRAESACVYPPAGGHGSQNPKGGAPSGTANRNADQI